MQIHELTPPPEITPPEWHRQLARFVRSASDHDRIDMRVALEMRDRDTAVRLLESYSDAAVLERKRAKKKRQAAKKRTFKYGRFGGWWYPGFHDDSGATADGGGDGGGGESVREASTPDGVSPSTQMFLNEAEKTGILKDFIARTMQRLKLENPPRVLFHKNSTWAEQNRSFGQFDPETNTLHVSLPDRHVMDIMRTIAHELTHAKQNEQHDLPDTAGETGSTWENSANAMAGIIMRDMAQANPGLFEQLDRPTPTVSDLAIKHGVGVSTILRQLKKGIQVELEHTTDPAVAREIALDHIAELPDYYTRLARVEKQSLEEGVLNKAAAAAALTAAMSMPVGAQDQQPDQPQAQSPTIGQVLNTALRLYGISRIREPQVRAEVEQEFRNYLRAQQGDPNAQNQSKIYQWERQLDEGASGYIPTKRQAQDPRFKTALTVDIKPGQVGHEANKLALNTDSQGRPGLLTKKLANALREFKEQGTISERCWTGYRQAGMKKKGSRMVPNCVPVEEDQELTEFRDRMYQYIRSVLPTWPEYVLRDWVYNLARGDHQAGPGFDPDEPNWKFNRETILKLIGREGMSPETKWRLVPDFPFRFDKLNPDTQRRLRERAGGTLNPYKVPNDEERHATQARLAQQQGGVRQEPVIGKMTPQGFELIEGWHRTIQHFRMYPNGYAGPVYMPVNTIQETLAEDQELTEVDMSPGALQKWARSDAAQRIRVGFEFEMYFPDTVDADRDDYDGGYDYEMDEEANSIRDIIEFFGGGNNPTARRVLNRVEEGLYETFAEWRQEQIADEASESGFYDYMEENEPDLREDKIEEFRQEAQSELGDDASDNDIDERTQDLYVEWINDQYSSGGRYYDDYMEWLSDSLGDSYDESDWLRSEMRYMSDVAQEEDLEWPWINEGRGGDGRSADDWAQELEGVIGMPVRTGSYHGSQRGEDHANLEPDGSLSEPDSDQDAGLELITPYRPLPEAMQILNSVIKWADDNGIYTNSSTGLHMNVSIEGVKNVDWVKLVLFLGDRYILDQFDRRYKMYASSSLDRIEAKIRDARPVQEQDEDEAIYSGKMDIEKALQMMRNNSIELARRAIQSGGGREKYQSVHVKELRDGSYIEFRGPGNDWLQKAQETERGLADTVYRLGRAMTIAADPEAERKEYARKLYKMLTPEDPNQRSGMKLFADYSAGVISREQLKRTWAEQVLRAQRRGRDRDAQAEYDIIDRETGDVIDTFTAVGDSHAVEKARDRVPPGTNYDVRLHDREAALSPKERRRSELALRVAGKPIWWRVSDKGGNYTGHVQAPTAGKAIDNFMQQEPAAMRISRDRFEARPEDPPTDTQSSTDPSAVDLNALPPGESDFMVSWDEFRTHEGREVRVTDGVRVTARNAAEASRRVHDSLQMQGREAFNVNAEPTDPPPWRRNREMPAAATDNITNPLHQPTDDTTERREYQIFYRDTNRPVVAFMAASDEEAQARLARFRREYPRSGEVGVRAAPGATRAQTTPPGEWTGRWLVQSTVTGETVHTISGIGNVQDDANRHAERWVRSTGFDDPIEVVPELQ